MTTENKNFGNNFNVTGFVVADPKTTPTANSNKVEFGVSIARKEGDNRISAIVNIQFWAKDMAAAEPIRNGNLVSVNGFFKPEEWTDKDGKKRNTVRFIAMSVKKIDSKQKAVS